MQIKVAKPKLYRNEAGQLVLHVAVKSHQDAALLVVSAYTFKREVVSAYTFKRDELAALPVHQEIHDTKKDPLTKPELVEMVRNMALMYAMSRGEPDIDIVSNHPTVKREPVIQVRKGKSNDVFETY